VKWYIYIKQNPLHTEEEEAPITVLYLDKYNIKTQIEKSVSSPVGENHKADTCPCLALNSCCNKLQQHVHNLKDWGRYQTTSLNTHGYWKHDKQKQSILDTY